MEIAIIGGSGHFNYALDIIKKDKKCKLLSVAPGSEGEDMKKLLQASQDANLTPTYYQTYSELLNHCKPDLVVLNTYCSVTEEIITLLLERHIHIFLEKPMALSLEALKRIEANYSNSKSRIMPMLGIRYKGSFLAAFKAINDGRIGEVRLIHAQKSYKLGKRGAFYNRRDDYGGILQWVGIHAIDWIHYVSKSSFESVMAHVLPPRKGAQEIEMAATAQFQMANGIIATLNADFYRPEKALTHDDDGLRVVGTEGIIQIKQNQVWLMNGEQNGEVQIASLEDQSIFKDFLNGIRYEEKCNVTWEQTVEVTKASINAKVSADENRRIVWGD